MCALLLSNNQYNFIPADIHIMKQNIQRINRKQLLSDQLFMIDTILERKSSFNENPNNTE